MSSCKGRYIRNTSYILQIWRYICNSTYITPEWEDIRIAYMYKLAAMPLKLIVSRTSCAAWRFHGTFE